VNVVSTEAVEVQRVKTTRCLPNPVTESDESETREEEERERKGKKERTLVERSRQRDR
jgi:hypothetical protein